MKYLLDTNIIIDHIRGRKEIQRKMAKEGISVSIISYGELLYGAEKSVNKTKSIEIINELFRNLPIRITPLNEDIMKIYANIKAGLEIKGEKLHDFDILIAASALNNSFTLITRNIKHFGRIPNLKFIS